MGKIPKTKIPKSSARVERATAAKLNVKRKAGLKRGFSIAQSCNPPKRSKRGRDVEDSRRSSSPDSSDLLAQRLRRNYGCDEEPFSHLSALESTADEDEKDEHEEFGEDSSDGTYKSCDSFDASTTSKSSTPSRSSRVTPKEADLKMFSHHGIVYIVLNDFARAAFGGSGYMLVLQGSVGLYGLKVSASENLVLPIESVPGSCVVFVNRGSKSVIGNLTESLNRIGASRSLSKAKEFLSRYPNKTIVAIQGRPENFTNLKPNFSSADDSTPENCWESSGFYVLPLPSSAVLRNRRFDDVVNIISKTAAKEPVKVVLAGPKNSGKSSVIRALCNRFLLERIRNDNPDGEQAACPILVLDLDPGQTEFTPPGCVSLVEVTETLMGPPNSHQIKPEKSYLVAGGSTPGAHPDMYVRSVELLMQHLYENNCANYILLVNTMGWLTGIGELLLGSILNVVEPTRLLCPEPEFDVPSAAWPCKEISCSPVVTHISPLGSMFATDPYTKAVNASLHREASIIGYFNGLSIMEKHPHAIPWFKVALHEISCAAPNPEILYLMNGNMVALCRVPDRLLLKSKSNPLLPKFFLNNRKDKEEPFECLGFGIVRCVDPVNKLIYVATPESSEIFDCVNALIYNSIPLPSYFYDTQTSDLAPYTQKEEPLPDQHKLLPLAMNA